MTAPAPHSQPEAAALRQDRPLPWIVGPFGDIWVAADVEIMDGKWRETCPEPRIVVTTGGLDKDPKLAAQIVEAVNNYERERDEAASYHKFWIEEREKSATLQARVDELNAEAEQHYESSSEFGHQLQTLAASVQEAIDILLERKHGSEARSPGHNARLILESALKRITPSALPLEDR